MDLHRLHTMFEHWAKFPPVHVSVAVYLGLGERDRDRDTSQDLDPRQSAGAILDDLISEGS
jgi:hypothetical protein